ncbi:extracellular solute-binding protein [Paenibacillaceae bacterium]|nr:extracellular solute-binding protein [Paenibacillaceae bacterium]
MMTQTVRLSQKVQEEIFMKKSLTFGMLLLFILVMVGCGQGAAKTDDHSTTPTAGTTGKASQAERPAGEETVKEVTLKLWYPGTEENTIQAINDIVAGFESENPHIKVELTTIPWAEYFQKVTVAYSGGLQPDVHGLGFGQLISTVNQDKYLDLQPFIARDGWEGSADFFPDILKTGQWKGGQYGLLMPEIRPLAWRKDFFEEAGLDPETPPATVEELFAFAEKLKVEESGQTVRAGIDIQTSNGEQSFLSLLLLYGEDIYDDEGNPNFDSDTSIKLLEQLVELYNNGVILPAHQQEIGGTPFVKSQAALALTSTANAALLGNAVGVDQLGWSLPPAGPSGAKTALVLGTFLTAAKDTKHPEEAWALIRYWFQRENILAFTSKTGFIPPLQSVKDDFIKLRPENAVSFDSLNSAQGYRASEMWAINVKYLRLALEEAYNGIKPAADALKDSAKLAREEISNLR